MQAGSAEAILTARGLISTAETICQAFGLITEQDLEELSDERIDASGLQPWQKRKLKCICAALRADTTSMPKLPQ
jgi:hypothetical protein